MEKVMSTMAPVALLAALLGAVAAYLIGRSRWHTQTESLERQIAESSTALSKAQADFQARQDELRRSLAEANGRETDAKRRLDESEKRVNQLSQENGRLQSEAGRIQELKTTLSNRDAALAACQRPYLMAPAAFRATLPRISLSTSNSADCSDIAARD
jgi:peptidoglycan hydrolase CwlO-like protein